MRALFLFIIFILPASAAWSQSFIFDDAESFADFNINREKDKLVCFYKTTISTPTNSHYRTIAFDSALNVVDTTSFNLKGVCRNLGGGENDRYIWHIFHQTVGKTETITFLITDKRGVLLNTWEKTADDFKGSFGKSFKKIERLQFSSIRTNDEAGNLLLIEPVEYSKGGEVLAIGKWTAYNMSDGAFRWELDKPVSFIESKAFNGKLAAFKYTSTGDITLQFYNLTDGKEIDSTPVFPKGSPRAISVFQISKDAITVAGSESESSKHNKFFLTRFDYDGGMVFDKIDTVERLPDSKIKLIGGASGRGNDIVLIGESFKMNHTKAIAKGIALSLLGGGIVVPASDPVISGLVSARISGSGDVTEFHFFHVEKRNDFSRLIQDQNQVFLRYKNDLLWYNLLDLNTPPQKFAKVETSEQVITFAGKLIGVRKDNKKFEIILENLQPN